MAYLGRQPNTGVRSRYIYTATASQTTFSGSDDDGKTLKYEDAAYLDVFLNGVLLKPVTDYAATSKTSVVLTSGAAVSDIVEIVAYDIANIADTVSKANGGTFDAGVTVNGTVTSDGLTVDGNLSVDNGTIKLDGNYPVGTGNVALGDAALDSNVSGASNIAIGADALTANTASYNAAVGYQAGYSNTTGIANVFVGFTTGYSNTTGNYNVGVGNATLYSTTTGEYNSALGHATLYSNTTGSYNVAIGRSALGNNTTASSSTAVGYQAGYSGTTAASNTLIGKEAGYSLTTANGNTFIGADSGDTVTTGQNNTVLGRYNGNQGGYDIRTSSNNIVLSDGDGNPRLLWTSGSGTWVAGPSSLATGAGTNTLKVNTSNGYITYDTSSARYKNNIRDSIYGLNHVMQMRSTQFEYKDTGRSDVGLIAEELDPIIPELVCKNEDGEPDAVSYDRMVSVLVKAIQELSAKNDALEARIAQLENA